jgi:hypothetical protein
MLEITDEFVDILRLDSTIISLTGLNSSDMRIYSWNPPFDIIYNSTYKAAIFIRDTQFGRVSNYWSYPSQLPDIMYYFACVSPTKTTTNQLEERIRQLLDMYSFDTLNYRIGVITLNNVVDGINDGTPTKPLYSRITSFTLREVFMRPGSP